MSMATKKTKCSECGAEIKKTTWKTKGKMFVFVEKNCCCDITKYPKK